MASPESRAPSVLLNLFLDRAAELFGTRLARSGGLDTSFSINFDRATGARFSISNPDEEDLRSYLLTYRQFISNDEPVFVNKIHNVLWHNLDSSSKYREGLAEAQGHWRQQCRQGMIALSIDGKALPPELLQDLWINGHYFHNDSRKRQDLMAMSDMAKLLVRHGFLDQVGVGSRYVAYLSSVIRFGRSQGALAL